MPFKDSIKFAIANYKPLIKLRNKKEFRRNILEISSLILKSNDSNSMSILSNLNYINEFASEDLDSYISMLKEDDYDYNSHVLINNYLSLFYSIPVTTNDSYIDTFTKKLTISSTNKWITFNTLKARLKHNLEIDSSIKKLYLDSLDTRFALIKT